MLRFKIVEYDRSLMSFQENIFYEAEEFFFFL